MKDELKWTQAEFLWNKEKKNTNPFNVFLYFDNETGLFPLFAGFMS